MAKATVTYDVFTEAKSELHVAGVTFHEDVVRKLEGKRLLYTMRKEPTNRFDPNAVAVWSPIGQVGYVPKDDALMYAGLIDVARAGSFNLAFWGEAEPWGPGSYIALDVPRFAVIRDATQKPLTPQLFTRLSVSSPKVWGAGFVLTMVGLLVVAAAAVVGIFIWFHSWS